MVLLHETRSLKSCIFYFFARPKVLPASQTGELHPSWATPVSLLWLSREIWKQRGAGSTPCYHGSYDAATGGLPLGPTTVRAHFY